MADTWRVCIIHRFTYSDGMPYNWIYVNTTYNDYTLVQVCIREGTHEHTRLHLLLIVRAGHAVQYAE